MERENIPADVRRRVLVEAGHRCAIPTCRATTTEIAHIEPWSDTRDDSFENLIALCPNCHTRYDQKKEIDRKAMKMYKLALRPPKQPFAIPFFLGNQEEELEVRPKPVLTVNSWMHNCTIERLLLTTIDDSGPVYCATILDIFLNGRSVFGNAKLMLDYGTQSSDAAKQPYQLLENDWDAGSKLQMFFEQVGGGTGYQLTISGFLRDAHTVLSP
jgi:hypothetical protein